MVTTYPAFEQQVNELVKHHRKVKKPQLRLAVYFAPPKRPKRDIFLLEVIDGFGGNSIDPEKKLFEFGYGSTPVLPLPVGTTLRMVLTNPTELNEAVRSGWHALDEIRAARVSDNAKVVYADATGKRLWDLIK